MGGRHVLGRGAHAEADVGARDEPAERQQRDKGQADGQEVDLGEGHHAVVELVGAVEPFRDREVLRRAGEQQDAEILQDVGHPQAGQQQRHVGGAAHRAVGGPLDDDAGEPAAQDAAEHRPAEGQAGGAQQHGGKGADHHHVAMGEVGHAQDAEDHRQADGNQGVEAAQADRVDQLLDDVDQRVHQAAPR